MKWTELRSRSDADLAGELEKMSEEMRNMRFQEAIGPLENPLLRRQTRRRISRVLTILRERRATSNPAGSVRPTPAGQV